MKIGLVTDSLGYLSFEGLIKTAAEMGIQMVEFCCGGWTNAPHLHLDEMLESELARRRFMDTLRDHGLEISALNCSGNHLAPNPKGQAHDAVVHKTMQLAKLLDVRRIVMMSGLPGGGPGDSNPNWVTTIWPPEVLEMLRYQWEDVAIPYWRKLTAFAREQGIQSICIEQHAHQLVYNTQTLLRLRDAAGKMIGANLDPSHMLWMGGDPRRAIQEMAGAIYHVHAKDTRIDPRNSEINTLIETKTLVSERSWNYVTLGYGHGENWWRDFITLLRQAGYDDVLSIEHEDVSMPALEGVKKSVALLKGII